MTKALEKIKQLIALGEKATQGEMSVSDRYREVVVQNGKRDFAHMTMDGEPFFYSDSLPVDEAKVLSMYDANFVAAAANSRGDLAELVAEYERMRNALEEITYMHIGDQPAACGLSELDFARQRNGKIRGFARQALKGQDDE